MKKMQGQEMMQAIAISFIFSLQGVVLQRNIVYICERIFILTLKQ